MNEKVTCAVCGNEFWMDEEIIATAEPKICSQVCADIYFGG